ncbi:ATP-binding protein [Oenococcus oeni]|uniref:DNA repair protein n=1 Tax=Oenococcus oeni TaxID=1247 RepID=A0A6H3GXB3_OENOE|nr:AAA family ATPase [Oenococcus oeni]AVI94052.1 DNA repair protein [Oenococcus oeni]EJO01850.1 DNA repair ATPase [Oenococcus oeni AWRIB418]KGH59559.1 DNA repair protein [Oenococcus oeni IOEB_9805]KGH62650.1 DNA repair protein [Oenococcus oeni S13]KGH75893.1 DNA repair protein [Oenococcus oeni IOEB_9803]
MEIKRIHISGFGKFSDFNLDFKNDLQVIYGQNEAGKSTLRQFITGILFGFAQNKRQSSNLYEPRNGSQYGGDLVFEQDGSLWDVSRLGRTQSKLEITDQNGNHVNNPEIFLTKLLSPFSQDSFEDIFSFDQEQLNEIRSLSGKELSDRLLSFSVVNADQWQSLSKELDKNASVMFGLTKTSKRPINQLLAEHQQISNQLNSMGGQLSDYRKSSQQKKSTLKRIAELDSQLHNLKKQMDEFSKLIELSGLFNRKERISMPKTNDRFSDQQISNLTDEIEQRVEKLQSQIKGINLDKSENKSTVIAENPLLTIYKNNRTDIDLLEKSIPNLIAENNLFDQNDNQIKNISSRLSELQNDLKTKFGDRIPRALPQGVSIQPSRSITVFFIIGIILMLLGVFGIVKGFQTPAFPYPFWICGAGVLFIGGLLSFFERPKKQSINLSQYGYSNQVSLDTIIDSQNHLQEYHQKIDQFQQLQNEKQSHLSKINSILKLANSLREFLPSAKQDHDALIDQIQVILNEIRDERQSALLSKEQKKLVDENRQQQIGHLQNLKSEQQQIFNYLKVDNYQNFQYLQAEKIKNKQRLNQLESINQLLTPEKENQIKELGGVEEITKKKQALKVRIDSIEGEIKQENQQLLNLNATLLNASSDTDYQTKLQQQSDLETDINNDLTEYFANKLASSWINESLYQISHKRMPEIRSRAEQYFAELTENKYVSIIFGDNSLLVANQQNEKFYSYELSKGSSEQLYVSLRLAFAESVAEKNSLPFLIDDSFVNFDVERKSIMDNILHRLAEKYQIIYFTANPDQNFSQSNIINLGEAANA